MATLYRSSYVTDSDLLQMQICCVRCIVVDSKICGIARKDSVYFNYIFLMSLCPWIWVTRNLGVWCNSRSFSDLQSLITVSFMEISLQMWKKKRTDLTQRLQNLWCSFSIHKFFGKSQPLPTTGISKLKTPGNLYRFVCDKFSAENFVHFYSFINTWYPLNMGCSSSSCFELIIPRL